jgi:hypothetical protein
MKHKFLLSALCLFTAVAVSAQKVLYKTDAETGAISQISLANDTMNWILKSDTSQYRWVGKNYGWGLGFFAVDGVQHKWEKPYATSGNTTHYRADDVQIFVNRFYLNNDLAEEYTFKNVGKKTLHLADVGINTPFNDNYPNAETCMAARCHAHIWAGGSAAYVNATRMSGQAPHLGLVLTQGAVSSYEVAERSREKGMSNFRGVIMLNPENFTLTPKENYTLAWRIFAHTGWDDFNLKLLDLGSVVAHADRYVYEKGETARLTFSSKGKLKNPKLLYNGSEAALFETENTAPLQYTADVVISSLGENRIELVYDGGKKTHVEVLGVSSYENLIGKRAEFILKNQQLKDTNDLRFGAFMVYDNELNKIYFNDTPNAAPSDRDEGRERVGMGNFLALYYLRNPNENLKKQLIQYADFLRTKLQDYDYKTYSNVRKTSRNRAYNYPWVASFYLRMFQVTAQEQYLQHAYGTLRAMYRQFRHGFYAIDISVELSLKLLRENAMAAQADTLLADFKAMGDTFVKNGTHYPRHEVNYEQSIVAPAVISLLQLYRVTGDKAYLASAEQQLPLLEAFAGKQPSCHMNEISIRHWDSYWFGKREMWGDNFPHYWSTLNAIAFNLYAQVTENKEYEERAKNILRNNLCLFAEDGRGSCAYIYPYKVNGEQGQFYDSYANDQDWALYFYLQVF